LDINVILVGPTNIADAQTAKGQQNLTALLKHVQDHYAQPGLDVKLGDVRVYKTGGCSDGSIYSTISFSKIGDMFTDLTGKLPAETDGKAVNVFLVSSIVNDSKAYTILGVAGAINGPPLNGTGASGVVFSSFNKLKTFNPECDGSGSCAVGKQDASFVDMGSTISHEMGHYLGLNHPTEQSGSYHDYVPDTPKCVASNGVVTHSSCLSQNPCGSQCGSYNGTSTFCATTSSCQFNHIMWYTTKNFSTTLDVGERSGHLLILQRPPRSACRRALCV
jgi:hypothetical protein